MRLGHLGGMLAVACLGLTGAGLAQTEPVPAADGPDQKPAQPTPIRPPGPEGRLQMVRPELRHAERVTWMGVGVSPAAPILEHQLNLKPGVGLVVDEVVPGSPAAKAGVEEYDVLQKLDDQLLVNPEQLATLVRMHKAGEEVTLTVIRQGKPTEMKVTLAEQSHPRMVPFMPPVRGPRGTWLRPGEGRPPNGPPHDDENGPPPHPERHTGPTDHPDLDREQSRFPRFDRLPNVQFRLQGDHPEIVVKDAEGHTLFSRDLDLKFEAGKFPFRVKVQVNKPDDQTSDKKDADLKGEHHSDDEK